LLVYPMTSIITIIIRIKTGPHRLKCLVRVPQTVMLRVQRMQRMLATRPMRPVSHQHQQWFHAALGIDQRHTMALSNVIIARRNGPIKHL
uniref:Transposase n=1 Tax=Anisakis simplex TaxID=6269 RepID=A0A0M3JNR8_ANISI